jgi:hypothetical protein
MLLLDRFSGSTVVGLGGCRGSDMLECTWTMLITADAILHRAHYGNSSQRTARVERVQSAGRENVVAKRVIKGWRDAKY